MIINVLEVITEFIGIILCLHKSSGKEIHIDRYVVTFSFFEICGVLVARLGGVEYRWVVGLVYVAIMLYVRLRLADTIWQMLKIFGIMVITLPSLQLLIYYATKFIFVDKLLSNEHGILINIGIIVIISIWKWKYLIYCINRLRKVKDLILVIILMLFVAYLLHLYYQFNSLYPQTVIHALISLIGISVTLVFLIDSEYEKRHKIKELQLYELYNKAFEDSIKTIRMRQHEFDNHINAIKCMQLSITNKDELIEAQNEYCEKVLKDNELNKLLKLHMEPIMVSFLYSKLMEAKEYGIEVETEIQVVNFRDKIEISELVEVMGILIDNAIEALESRSDSNRKIIVKILCKENTRLAIYVSNTSRKYTNMEFEKFFECGYSTKGKNRGLGLCRVKEICRKYDMNLSVSNVAYGEKNYVEFCITE